MTNHSRAVGTSAERAVVDYLAEHGWPSAERRALCGRNDRGDVTGTPGLVWEIKAGQKLELLGWLRETETERRRDEADYGILVVRGRGLAVENWPAVLPLSEIATLLRQAGYGGDGLGAFV